MAKFLLLLRDDPVEFTKLSPEEMQRVLQKYGAWGRALAEKGRLLASHKLTDEGGKVVRGQGERFGAVDGPYAEGKEIVAGFFLIEARDYSEALDMVRECPHLQFGTVELREVDPLTAAKK